MQCIRSNIYNNECIFNFIVKDFLNRVYSVRTCVIMNTICLYEFLSGSPFPFLQYLPQSPYIHAYTHIPFIPCGHFEILTIILIY